METNVTNGGGPEMGLARQLLITFSFVVGAVGNIAALWILFKSANTRNSKHVLMLSCLATNDLIAELGMLLLMNLNHYQIIPLHWRCVLFVCLRAFGLGSGCVAFVMALERWLALTRPFLYQQLVTYQMIKRAIFGLWAVAVFITYLPLFGFGLYYDKGKCPRYRDAKELKDVIYAYLFFTFGTTLCFCIAWCNLTVIWEVARIGRQKRTLVRRVSRSIISSRIDGCSRYVTAEELAFAKLMAVLCIIFLVCWMPQMILILMAQFYPESKFCKIFTRIADMLMCIYLTLDPYVYVLHRYMEKSRLKFPRCCHRRRRSVSTIQPSNTTVAMEAVTPTSVLLQPPSFTIPVVM